MSRIGFQHFPHKRWIDGKDFEIKPAIGEPELQATIVHASAHTPIRPPVGACAAPAAASYIACGAKPTMQICKNGLLLHKEIRQPIEINQIFLVGGKVECDRCGSMSNVFTDAEFDNEPKNIMFCSNCVSESVTACSKVFVTRALAEVWKN